MLILELLFGLAAIAVALIVLVVAGCAIASILLDEQPETLLSDPAARRALLRG